MAQPKWTDERVAALTAFVGPITEEVSQDTVTEASENGAIGGSTRSVASKLRKMGYEVQKTSAARTKAFTDEQEATLRTFVEGNSGSYTYAEIAENFPGDFNARQIQGKILSMELTDHVKQAERKEYVRSYTDEETATFVNMANEGKFLEEIADALGRSVPSIRGKALSLDRSGDISGIPAQRDKVAKAADAFEGLDIAGMTVAEIAEKTDKTERGVKTMLTRRGLTASDYDGAAKAAKAAAKD